MNRLLVLPLLPLLALFGSTSALVACTVDATVPSGPAAGADGGGSGAGGGTGSGGSGAGGSATAGEDAGPGTPASTELFPLEDGRVETFRFVRGARQGCQDTLTLTTSGPHTDADGSSYWRVTASCGPWPVSDYTTRGDETFVRTPGSDWYRAFVLPPTEGAGFGAGGASGAQYTWTKEPSVTVPAGTFTDCWRLTQVGYANVQVLCPGEGRVLQDFQAFGFDEKLVRE